MHLEEENQIVLKDFSKAEEEFEERKKEFFELKVIFYTF